MNNHICANGGVIGPGCFCFALARSRALTISLVLVLLILLLILHRSICTGITRSSGGSSSASGLACLLRGAVSRRGAQKCLQQRLDMQWWHWGDSCCLSLRLSTCGLSSHCTLSCSRLR